VEGGDGVCGAKVSGLWNAQERLCPHPLCAHRHVVFSIPKMFRIFFLYNRKLLTELSRCAWNAIRQYFEVCSPEGTLPAGILSIATAGDFLNWNPHIHALVSSGTFHADGSFVPAALFAENVLRELFEAYVYKLLVSKRAHRPRSDRKDAHLETQRIPCLCRTLNRAKRRCRACGTLYCARSGFRIQITAYRGWSDEIPGQRISAKRSMRFSVSDSFVLPLW